MPADVIATVMVLQALEGLSDRAAVCQPQTNIAWKVATGLALTDKALDSTVLSATSITDVLVQPLTDKPPSAKELQLQQQAVFRDPASRARMEAGIYQSRGLSIVVTEISPDTPEELEKLRSWYASELERRQVSTTIPFGPLDRRILVDLEFEMNASGFAHKE